MEIVVIVYTHKLSLTVRELQSNQGREKVGVSFAVQYICTEVWYRQRFPDKSYARDNRLIAPNKFT